MALRVCIWSSLAGNGRFEISQGHGLDLVMEIKRKHSFHFPRHTLLVEIERRCAFPGCVARNQIGLTKAEAIEYRGFECFQCEPME
jgi:hypothetical protein